MLLMYRRNAQEKLNNEMFSRNEFEQKKTVSLSFFLDGVWRKPCNDISKVESWHIAV